MVRFLQSHAEYHAILLPGRISSEFLDIKEMTCSYSAKDTIKNFFVDRGLDLPAVGSCLAPMSNDITMHYSFDMAQQVWYNSLTHDNNKHVHGRSTTLVTPSSQAQCTS